MDRVNEWKLKAASGEREWKICILVKSFSLLFILDYNVFFLSAEEGETTSSRNPFRARRATLKMPASSTLVPSNQCVA
jgi:hypothetical protein